jgi:hypothetical protein
VSKVVVVAQPLTIKYSSPVIVLTGPSGQPRPEQINVGHAQGLALRPSWQDDARHDSTTRDPFGDKGAADDAGVGVGTSAILRTLWTPREGKEGKQTVAVTV